MSNGLFSSPPPNLGKPLSSLDPLFFGQSIRTSRVATRPKRIKRTILARAKFDFIGLIAAAIETFGTNRLQGRQWFFRFHNFLWVIPDFPSRRSDTTGVLPSIRARRRRTS